jgi:hypothetical protein
VGGLDVVLLVVPILAFVRCLYERFAAVPTLLCCRERPSLRWRQERTMAMTKCKECGTEISTKAEPCPKCGAKAPKKTSAFTWLVAGLMVLGFIGYISGNNTGSTVTSTATQSPAPAGPTKAATINNVKLDFSWSKAGYDNIMKANFTFTNKNTYPVKDLEITCTHSAPSGTVIDKNVRTIYEIVPANGKRTFRDFDMGFIHSQVKASGCEITDLTF